MIIDTHTHIFNFNEIPVKGNLNARIWKLPSIILEKLVEMKLIKSETCWLDKNQYDKQEISKEKILKSINALFLDDYNNDIKNDLEQLLNLYENISSKSRNILYPIEKLFNITYNLKEWLELATGTHENIVKKMFNTYKKVDLFIPLMMDMEYWLEDETIKTPFEIQIVCMKKLIIKHEGKFHPFIAFNPERVRENPDKEFDIIKNAIENNGFIGIKLYPPLGYKPVNNNIEEDGVELSKNSIKHGLEYDKILNKLFKYCSDNDIPITTHCNSKGANAYKGSGKLAHPKYWEEILKKYDNLKVNFAHFGGDNRFLKYNNDDSNKKNWALKITELMRKHPNVYSDVSYHPIILSSKKGEYIKELESRFEDSPILKKRLMYGSDWHMLSTNKNHEEYFHEFRNIYEECFFESERYDFFSNNAINFLGLKPNNETWKRLKNFYISNDMKMPKWWINN